MQPGSAACDRQGRLARAQDAPHRPFQAFQAAPLVALRGRRQQQQSTTCRSGAVTREVLNRAQRKKLDEEVDSVFYSEPRLVKHVDEGFLAAVTRLYREIIPPGGDVLDLMSSWVSHLPTDVSYGRVVGHGMNPAELARNKQLDSFFVRNLNREPTGWAAADASFDAVLCCVSVQYLQQPEAVFAEIYRVLRPGGACIVTFSNRLYYSKAVAAWRDAPNDFARIQLVKQYFMCVDGFTLPDAYRELPQQVEQAGLGGLLQRVQGLFQQAQRDPFYAVVAYKDHKPQRK